ncbi:MAG: MFS transporter [Acidobacteria bacterium]|nr:MFS transporter [Acidobacteriota bacterium]
MSTVPTSPAQETPTRARYIFLFLAFLVSFITYLDRVCISQAAPAMSGDLGLSGMEMSYVFSAFALAYGLFEIPMGWLGDRFGQRKLLTRIVAGWSVFTVLTGMVKSYFLLLLTRFAFGAAEAGAFPTLARALARWFPRTERGRVNGFMWMGARAGAALAPPIAAWCIGAIGWRETFYLFGSVGSLWCIAFWRWYRDDPADHPAVNKAELEYIQSGTVQSNTVQSRPQAKLPWTKVFQSGTLWALFVMYFCSAYGSFFFVTWMPTYLMEEHGMTLERSGLLSGLPMGIGAIACVVGGTFSDWLIRRTGSIKWGRRIVGIGGYGLAAVGFGIAAQSRDAWSAILWLSFAQGVQDLALPVAWATCVDVGGRLGGTATGFMNTASSMSAMISPIAAAWLRKTYGSFTVMFSSCIVIYLIASVMWMILDPSNTIHDQEEEHAET